MLPVLVTIAPSRSERRNHAVGSHAPLLFPPSMAEFATPPLTSNLHFPLSPTLHFPTLRNIYPYALRDFFFLAFILLLAALAAIPIMDRLPTIPESSVAVNAIEEKPEHQHVGEVDDAEWPFDEFVDADPQQLHDNSGVEHLQSVRDRSLHMTQEQQDPMKWLVSRPKTSGSDMQEQWDALQSAQRATGPATSKTLVIAQGQWHKSLPLIVN